MGRSRQKVRQSKVDCIVTILIYIILVIIGLMTLFPFMDVVFNSLTSSKELVENAKAVIAIPKHPTLENYKYVLSGNSIFRAYGVTVFRTVVGTLLNLVITVMTAYPLSKKFLPGRNVLMQIFFFTMIFSGGMIPTYLVVKTFKLSNTIWALIIPSLLNVYNMIIMRTFFEGISEELEDAARIDGCSEWKTLLKIVLPVSKPTLASIALFYAVWHWNSFFDVYHGQEAVAAADFAEGGRTDNEHGGAQCTDGRCGGTSFLIGNRCYRYGVHGPDFSGLSIPAEIFC